MKKKTIMIGLLLVVGLILLSFYSSKDREINEEQIDISVGAADPAPRYARKMGCERRVDKTKEEGDYAYCIFPDGSECEEWAFYRGKCGQEWSYCAQQGYGMKDLTQNEGWEKGGICIDKNTGEEIGSIYDLMNLREELSCQ